MKGISTILAMILIVIIVVALIGLTYTFAVGLFQTTTSAATTTTTNITSNILKSVYIIGTPICTNSTTNMVWDWVNFTIQNTGTLTINPGDLYATIDGNTTAVLNTTNAPINSVSISPGKTMSFYANISKPGGQAAITTRYLTVSAPAADVYATLTGC
jgi:FlaG/FlaF family flagellin (archaellin)